MCQSKSTGGKRCAAHTRPRFEAATFGTPEWDTAAADYARTKEGNATLTQEMNRTASSHSEVTKHEACRQALETAKRADETDAMVTGMRVRQVAESSDPERLESWAKDKNPRIVQAAAANESTPDDVTRHLAETGNVKVRRAIAKRYLAPDDVYARLTRDPNPTVRSAVPPALRQPLGQAPSLEQAREQYETATYGTDEWAVAAAQYARTDEGYAAILWDKMNGPHKSHWAEHDARGDALLIAQRYGQQGVPPARAPHRQLVGA